MQPVHVDNNHYMVEFHRLGEELRRRDLVSYVEVISKARVPIVKFTDRVSGIKVDICCEQPGGLAAAELILEVQKTLPSLRPLTLVLKYFLHCRGLNDTFSGLTSQSSFHLPIDEHLNHVYENDINRWYWFIYVANDDSEPFTTSSMFT
jgi:DNA polymerase sigma